MYYQFVHIKKKKKRKDERDCLTSSGPIDKVKTLTNTSHAIRKKTNILSLFTTKRIFVMQLNISLLNIKVNFFFFYTIQSNDIEI